MNTTDFVILALATWRLAVLITKDAGPAGILLSLRASVGCCEDKVLEGSLAELVTCPYCLSVWLGILMTVFYAAYPEPTRWLALPAALAGVAAVLQRLTDYGSSSDDSMPGEPPEEDMLAG